MQGITTHVLDTSRGKPATGIAVRLEQRGAGGDWRVAGEGRTNSDGRVANLLGGDTAPSAGEYRLVFDTRPYFVDAPQATLYPTIAVHFETAPGQTHYHLPLLLNPFGYTTYRGT